MINDARHNVRRNIWCSLSCRKHRTNGFDQQDDDDDHDDHDDHDEDDDDDADDDDVEANDDDDDDNDDNNDVDDDGQVAPSRSSSVSTRPPPRLPTLQPTTALPSITTRFLAFTPPTL